MLAQNEGLGIAYWENTEPQSSEITAIFIDDRSQDIIVFQNCYDGPCNWGREMLWKSGNDYIAHYDQDFVQYRFRVRKINENRIAVLAKMKYRDHNEWDYYEYSFRRSFNQRESGGISAK